MTQKIVEFENWCKKCVHCAKKENEEPCDECLEHSTNEDSHRPVKFQNKAGA